MVCSITGIFPVVLLHLAGTALVELPGVTSSCRGVVSGFLVVECQYEAAQAARMMITASVIHALA